MNTIKRIAAMACVAIAVVALASLPAHGQVTSTTLTNLSGLPSIINVNTTSNTAAYIDLVQGKGLAASWKFTASAGTSNAVLRFYPTLDGTNYATTTRFQLVANATDTTQVIATTNWSALDLAGYRRLKLGQMYNQNATGIVTNEGVMYSRQN